MNETIAAPQSARRPFFERFGLTARLTLLVGIMISMALTAFGFLSSMRLEKAADVQIHGVNALAASRVADQMRLQSALVNNGFRVARNATRQAISALAQRNETAVLLSRGNIVAIDLLLKRLVDSSDALTSVLAFDADLKPLGSHSPGLDLLRADSVFKSRSLFGEAKVLVANNDRRAPVGYTDFIPADLDYASALGMNVAKTDLLVVSMQPVFDDFGDVSGLLVAHFQIRSGEPADKKVGEEGILPRFSQLARVEKLGIRILSDEEILFETGSLPSAAYVASTTGLDGMVETEDGQHLMVCRPFDNGWRLCISESKSLLTDLTDPLENVIQLEKRAIEHWLLIFGILTIGLTIAAALLAVRRVLKPLQQITAAVRSVARGNWLAHVAGRRRKDEVGDIARAVTVLQRSMKERERLRANVADVEEFVTQQHAFGLALSEHQSVMRQRLFNLSDLSEDLEGSIKSVSELATQVEGEVDEARLVVHRLSGTGAKISMDNSQALRAVDRIGETTLQLKSHVGQISQRMESVTGEARWLDRDLKAMIMEGEHTIGGLKSAHRPVSRLPAREAELTGHGRDPVPEQEFS